MEAIKKELVVMMTLITVVFLIKILFFIPLEAVPQEVSYSSNKDPVPQSEKPVEISLKYPDYPWVSLNTATLDDLTSLKGIGPVLADRILAYISNHGPFNHLDELKNVKGIGDQKYLQILPFLVLDAQILDLYPPK